MRGLGWMGAAWGELRNGMPGRRFQDYNSRQHEQPSGELRRRLRVGGGVLFMLLGMAMMLTPGPGLLVFLAGAAISAAESHTAARALDWCELRLRRVLARLREPS